MTDISEKLDENWSEWIEVTRAESRMRAKIQKLMEYPESGENLAFELNLINFGIEGDVKGFLQSLASDIEDAIGDLESEIEDFSSVLRENTQEIKNALAPVEHVNGELLLELVEAIQSGDEAQRAWVADTLMRWYTQDDIATLLEPAYLRPSRV